MRLSSLDALLLILVVAGFTLLTRAVPFLLFPDEKRTPKFIFYLGRVLPHAIIGMLVIYCLKEISFAQFPFGLPELLSVIAVVVVHAWKGSTLFSIGGGTVLYMFLIQIVFVG